MTERLQFHFSLFTFMHWRRKWQPAPVFLPGESQGRRSLTGYSPWDRKESDMTERLSTHTYFTCNYYKLLACCLILFLLYFFSLSETLIIDMSNSLIWLVNVFSFVSQLFFLIFLYFLKDFFKFIPQPLF